MKSKAVVDAWILTLLIGSMLGGSGHREALAQDFYTRDIIDTPTAGLLPRGSYLLGLRAYPEGGIIAMIGVGLLERLELGLSFGGTNVIGDGDVDWNPGVEFAGRYRLFDETLATPALAIGFDSQGWGRYRREAERYDVKSRGFYGVLGKNYSFLGQLGIHLGANVSLEGKGDDKHRPNIFFSLQKSLNPDLYIVAEYDLPITGNSVAEDIDSGVGFINAGVRFLVDEHLFIELDLRNINQNAKDSGRTLRIAYQNGF
ncbi:MAG: hypothetical protein A2Z06_03645 [Candidatus Glassbacteria bacterium RBG_16_58_8]|uniref:Uncharacterized protein n=1 Tax=Candidatus Glassbacteria bacterium RBG_16_58_8 TaxID=1817866 RepID=A0A1F5YCX9_9BACT|nr:MAG: hypothetical protein A2Z06_03645 [Candidatus Glassbacteria bacterium RBG_16_58_8]